MFFVRDLRAQDLKPRAGEHRDGEQYVDVEATRHPQHRKPGKPVQQMPEIDRRRGTKTQPQRNAAARDPRHVFSKGGRACKECQEQRNEADIAPHVQHVGHPHGGVVCLRARKKHLVKQIDRTRLEGRAVKWVFGGFARVSTHKLEHRQQFDRREQNGARADRRESSQRFCAALIDRLNQDVDPQKNAEQGELIRASVEDDEGEKNTAPT